MEIVAKERSVEGKKVKNLRKEGVIPAVLFGKDVKPVSLSLESKAFNKVYEDAGETALVDLIIDKKSPIKVLLTNVQTNPISNQIIHASLHKVKLTEKITAKIPIEIVGETDIVKSGEGIILHLLNELEVECLPTDLPQDILVDISKLVKIDDFIAVKDLPLDRNKIEIKADPEELVVKIDYAKQQEQEEEEAPVSEVEQIAKVEATKELSEEEKAKREAEKKEEKK